MSQGLPAPEIMQHYVDDCFHATVSAMTLRWPEEVADCKKLWELPNGVSIVGPPPECFGYHVQRLSDDAYALRLVWNQTSLSWPVLSRLQVLSSALAPVLAALGTNVWDVLEQPVHDELPLFSYAA